MIIKLVFIFLIISFGVTYSDPLDCIGVNDFIGCEGQDAGNYTVIITSKGASGQLQASGTIIQYDHYGKPIATNSYEMLAFSSFPIGANVYYEGLWLVTGGPLAGKWIYVKALYMNLTYLKKFSSVLGRSYLIRKNFKLLFANRLDPNVLISPTGGYETFKKSAHTVCTVSEFII